MEINMQGLASELVENFGQLQDANYRLCDALSNIPSDYKAWTMGLGDQVWRHNTQHHESFTNQDWIREIYSCFDHRHNGDGRDTWQMAGLYVVPHEIIQLAETVNDWKDKVAMLSKQYQQATQQSSKKMGLNQLLLCSADNDTQIYAQLSSNARQLLQRVGYHRIHLRMVTRHILTIPEYPKHLSLSWVRQRRSIQKIDFKSCENALLKMSRDADNSHIEQQLHLLHQLESKKYHLLRKVQTVAYPAIKLKAYWSNGLDSHLGYLSVPALIPEATTQKGQLRALPPMTDIAAVPPPARAKRRSDNRLPEEAFLPSIRVYLQME